jgi:putative hemolysin
MKTNLALSILITMASALSWAGPSITAGTGNPAAVLCRDLGGQSINLKNKGGEFALCQFGEGGRIEQWTLFSQLNGHPQQAVAAFLSPAERTIARKNNGGAVGMANPASVYCGQAGGNLEIATSKTGEVGLCVFPDHSSIEEWSLFLGPTAEVNAKLVEILNR